MISDIVLLEFYKLDPKRRLPYPSEPLSTTISTFSIAPANKEVKLMEEKKRFVGKSARLHHLFAKAMNIRKLMMPFWHIAYSYPMLTHCYSKMILWITKFYLVI